MTRGGNVPVFEKIEETLIPGCYLIRPWRRTDERGLFVKTFHAETFRETGLQTDLREEYYSISHRGVLRGMHFQLPPYDHAKLVYCVKGCVLDAIVDLRRDAGGYGVQQTFELSDQNSLVLYIAAGVAHGFYTQSAEAVMVYNVTVEFQQDADSGVRWNSCGIEWPDDAPTVSARDSNLQLLSEAADVFKWNRNS